MSNAVIVNNSSYASSAWNKICTHKGKIVAAALGITAGIGVYVLNKNYNQLKLELEQKCDVIPSFTTAKQDCEKLAEKVHGSCLFNTNACGNSKNEFNLKISSWKNFRNSLEQECDGTFYYPANMPHCNLRAKRLSASCFELDVQCKADRDKFVNRIKDLRNVRNTLIDKCWRTNAARPYHNLQPCSNAVNDEINLCFLVDDCKGTIKHLEETLDNINPLKKELVSNCKFSLINQLHCEDMVVNAIESCFKNCVDVKNKFNPMIERMKSFEEIKADRANSCTIPRSVSIATYAYSDDCSQKYNEVLSSCMKKIPYSWDVKFEDNWEAFNSPACATSITNFQSAKSKVKGYLENLKKCSKLILTASNCEEKVKDLLTQCSSGKYSCDYATRDFNEFLKEAESVDTFPQGICTQSKNKHWLESCEFRTNLIKHHRWSWPTTLDYISQLKRFQQLWPKYDKVEKECSKHIYSFERNACERAGEEVITHCDVNDVKLNPWQCQSARKNYDFWVNLRGYNRQNFKSDPPPPKPVSTTELEYAEKILGLKTGYSEKDFTRAFRKFGVKNHPDKFTDKNIKKEKDIIFKRVSAVYSDLYNPNTKGET